MRSESFSSSAVSLIVIVAAIQITALDGYSVWLDGFGLLIPSRTFPVPFGLLTAFGELGAGFVELRVEVP